MANNAIKTDNLVEMALKNHFCPKLSPKTLVKLQKFTPKKMLIKLLV
jgi:hypothetical protein